MFEQPDSPASIGGVLDNGFKLFRACFAKVVGLAIVASFLGQITNFAMMGNVDANGLPQMSATLGIAILLTMLFSLIFYGAIVGRIHGVYTNSELSIGEAFGLGFACMIPLLICLVCYMLAIIVGSLLLLIPGIILAVSLMFAPYIVIAERASGVGSLKQSHNLIWGHWWRTMAIVSIAGFIMMVAYVLVGIVAGVFIAMDPASLTAPGFSLTQAVVTSLLGGLMTPLFYSLTMATYYDLRLRREGDDLAARIDAEPVPA